MQNGGWERMTVFELQILDFIQYHLRSSIMDGIMKAVSLAGTAGFIWILIAVLLFIPKKTRIDSISMSIAVVIGVVLCSIVIKPLAARLRPCDVNSAVQLLIARPHDYSFPSGHTTAAFAAAACLFFCRSRLWPFLMLFAVIMAFSRLYLYVHFPTDVLAGCVLGFICGWAGYRLGVSLKTHFQ